MVSTAEKQRRKKLIQEEELRREMQKNLQRQLGIQQKTGWQTYLEKEKEAAAKRQREAAETQIKAALLREKAEKARAAAAAAAKSGWDVTREAGRAQIEGLRAAGRGLKATGAYSFGGARAVGRGTRWSGQATVEGAKAYGRAGRFVGQKTAAGASYAATNVFPFFVICVLVYLFEFGSHFNSSVTTRLFIYQVLALWASLGVFKSGEMQNTKVVIFSIGSYLFFMLFNFSGSGFLSSTIGPAIAVLSPFIIGTVFRSFPFLLSGVIFIGPMIKGLALQTGLPMPDILGFGLDTINMVVLGPLWIYYIIFLTPRENLGAIAKFVVNAIATAILIFWIVVAWSPTTAYASQALDQYQASVDTYRVYGETSNLFTSNANYMYDKAKEIPPAIVSGFKTLLTGQLDIATGGLYSQNLDKQKVNSWLVKITERHVLYLPGMEDSKVFNPGSTVTVSGVFKGQSNEQYARIDYGQDIDFGCRIRQKGFNYKDTGNADVKKIPLYFLVQPGYVGEQSVVCKTSSTVSGETESAIVEIFGQTGVQPESSLDVSFIDKRAKLERISTGTDTVFKSKPKARPLTGGPVAIAAEFEETYPVVVAEDLPLKKLLITIHDFSPEGIAVQHGRIANIGKINIILPGGLRLEKGGSEASGFDFYCTYYDGEKSGFITTVENSKDSEGNKVISSWEVTPIGVKYPVEDRITLRCYVGFEDGARDTLLGGFETSTKQLTIKADIVYEVYSSISVDVKKRVPGGGGGITGSTASRCETAKKILGIAQDLEINDPVEWKFILATAQQESSMEHCQKGGNKCPETREYVKHEGNDFGIMQINEPAHGECFIVQSRGSPPCDGNKCSSTTVLNIDCNIEAGIKYYHIQYQKCGDGRRAYCNYKGGSGAGCSDDCKYIELFDKGVTYVESNYNFLLQNPDASCPTTSNLVPIKDVECSAPDCRLIQDAYTALINAEAEAVRQGEHLVVYSAYRTPEKQAELYNKYIQGSGSEACGPGDDNYEHCPHVNGTAVDIRLKNAGSCRGSQAAGQKLRTVMTSANWKYIVDEPTAPECWHYEYK